ncbi:F-box protein SKIP23 [Sesamum alatum]|uniref:F-box protein SKIP23 n=1 Tax=Sesamum alatum TaxID=300844 RepID=A0AAE1YNL6_9LAMI|nr:F-box protein SKIP23 [Sesamum alatum]
MAIHNNNKLWYIKSGDEKWTLVSDKWTSFGPFADVVNHKGHIYVTDRRECTWVFDSMFELTNVTGVLNSHSPNGHLVELYKGELFSVGCCPRLPSWDWREEFIILRFDEQGEKWVETKTVDNQIIFIGDDCSFSVSAHEFEDCKGSRVFYTNWDAFFPSEKYYGDVGYDKTDPHDYCFVPSDDVKLKFRELHGHNVIGVHDFATGKTGSVLKFPEYADIFCPPPPPHLGSPALSCNSETFKMLNM